MTNMGEATAGRPARLTVGQGEARDGGFEEWRWAIDPLFRVETAGEAAFDGELSTWLLGPMMLGRCRSNGHEFHRDAAQVARSGLDHLLVQLLVEGEDCLLSGAPAGRSRPGDLRVLDLSRTARTATGPYVNLSLVLPRDLVAPYLSDPDGAHGLHIDGASPVGRLLGDHIRTLWSVAPSLTPAEVAGLSTATAALVGACLKPLADGREAAIRAADEARLWRIRDWIDANLASPDLDALAVCRAFGLSRTRLYDLFAPLGGVAGHIRQRRLSRAFRSLTGPGGAALRIADVSRANGFVDEDVFSRAFRGRFGLTPRDARALRGASPAALSEAEGAAGMRDWFSRL
ncbi:helix-turn-helix domain-containing protein [Caulobacter sp. NIBR1757]|uniref:AraC-like ligand-binding domain-containing protein n=1 Tax=Caulobacter sp. NIBR1757 TaxID=3016000 RepID=UPI0022EFE808|nr:helix-turn-helix domain-containing protein [Caulobacter sp. NIBR1757]